MLTRIERCVPGAAALRLRWTSGAVYFASAGCSYDAWLGMQCPSPDVGCEDAGAAAHSGDLDAGSVAPSKPAVETVIHDAGPPETVEPRDAGDAAGTCRSVAMSYFACASGAEMAGAPRLQGSHAYTLRFRGAYTVDTTFQLQGSTAACSAVMLGTLTVAAGASTAERCLMPSEDLALLVTVVSGDVQVWAQNGLMAELCDGCD